jgi:cytochrome c oxidase cbb3-type subunit III
MADHDFDGIKYRDDGNRSPLIFRILFGALALWGVLFMGYYLLSGWSSEKEFAQQQKLAAAKSAEFELKESSSAPKVGGRKSDPAAYLASGKEIFSQRCVACHGADAKGGIGPDLTRSELKYGKSEAAILESVSNGRPGGMPGFGKELGHEQLEGVVTYLLSLK